MTRPILDSVDDLYRHLEEVAGSCKDGELTSTIVCFRDARAAAGDTEQAQHAQWELLAFIGTVGPEGVQPNFDGTPDLDAQGLDYWVDRVTRARHPALVARYAHLLWCSSRRHGQYAERAVDAYLELVPILEREDRALPERHLAFRMLRSLASARAIGNAIHYRQDDVRAEALRLVRDFDPESPSSFRVKGEMIELLLEERRALSASDIRSVRAIADQEASRLEAQGLFPPAIEMLELMVKLASACGEDVRAIQRRIAQANEKLMDLQDPERGWEAQHFCMQAVVAFRAAGDEADAARLERMIPELVRNAKLGMIEPGPEAQAALERVQTAVQQTVEKVTRAPSPDILKYLILSPDLVPSKTGVEAAFEAAKRQGMYSFRSEFAAEVSDGLGNLAEHAASSEEKARFYLLEQYRWQLWPVGLALVHGIIFESVKAGKLDAEVVLDYLENQTWLGAFLSRDVAGERVQYRLLDLLAPGIRSYFMAIRAGLANPEAYPIDHAVGATDSLTLKIEGVLRCLNVLAGGSESYVTRDRQGRPLSRARDLDDLLRQPLLVQMLGPDTTFFLRFLLVEKAGLNLRHRIAHSLMITPEYALENLHLLFVAIMRLAPFSLTPGLDNDSDREDSRGS